MLMSDVEINLVEKLRETNKKEEHQLLVTNKASLKLMILLMLLAMKVLASPKINGKNILVHSLKKLNKLFTKIKVKLKIKNSIKEKNNLLNSF